MSMLRELRRRHVLRVGAAYLAGSWLLIQLMSNIFPLIGFSADAGRPVVILLAIGFVPALVLAWVFQLTPKGITRDTGASAAAVGANAARRLDRAIIVVLALAVALFAVDRFVLDPRRDAHLVAATAERVATDLRTASAGDKSVAVLPFADLSETGDQTWLADGLAEEIRIALAQLPELDVIARASSFQFRGQNRDIGQIAEQLGVANVVEGSVRRSGERLRITAQLIRTRDGIPVWSDAYDQTSVDVLDVQRDVAERIAAALDVVLDDERRAAMLRSGTRNVEAFEYAQRGWALARVVHERPGPQTLWDANVLFERALAIDPGYGNAALGAADAHAHLLIQGPIGIVANPPYPEDEALPRLLATIDVAIEGSPNEATHTVAELVKELFSPTWYRMPTLIERLRETWDLGSVDVELMGYAWPILQFTENYDLMREMTQQYVILDPLTLSTWVHRINVELQSNNRETAAELIQNARRAVGDHPLLQGMEMQTSGLAFAGPGSPERAATIARLEAMPDAARNPLIPALKGDRETALRLAAPIASSSPRPILGLSLVYCLVGAYDDARDLMRSADAAPAGPARLLLFASGLRNIMFKDFAATPNFVRQLGQAGIDPATYRGDCPPSAGAE